jgi:hypothetical protein
MKTAIRLFALSFVIVSAAAAATAPASKTALSNHQATSASVPIPACGPYIPGCDNKPVTSSSK